MTLEPRSSPPDDLGTRRRRVWFSIAVRLALLSFGNSAHAFFDPPWVIPQQPTANDVVSVDIRGGMCDGIVEWPGYPQVTWDGNSIRLVEYGVHETFEDFCIYPTGTLTEPIGTFPPGDYTLTVDFVYDNYPFGPATITLGVIPFTVTGTGPTAAAVPSASFASLALLVALLVITAMSKLAARAVVLPARWCLVLISVATSIPVWASPPLFDPYVEPADPTAADPVTYFAWWDGCGNLRAPSIAQNGNIIEISQPIEIICAIPVGGGLVHYDLGRFAPGNYRVHVRICSYFYGECLPSESPPDVPFSVGGALARPVPLGTRAIAVLGIGVLLVGAFRCFRSLCAGKYRSPT